LGLVYRAGRTGAKRSLAAVVVERVVGCGCMAGDERIEHF
jgi:hypothetical protein